MPRSRSRSRDRRRGRDSSRDRDRDRGRRRGSSRERRRSRSRDRDRESDRHGRDRDRGRDQDSRRSRDSRSRSRSRDQRSRRSRSRERGGERDQERERSRGAPAPAAAAAAGGSLAPEADPGAAERLARLEAWKAARASAAPGGLSASVPGTTPPQPAAADPPSNPGPAAADTDDYCAPHGGLGFGAGPTKGLGSTAPAFVRSSAAPDLSPPAGGQGFVPASSAGRGVAASAPVTSAAASAAYVAAAAAAPGGADGSDQEVDPLDAFMATEILPEVVQKQAEEARQREEQRIKHAELLAAGKAPKKLDILEESDSEPEPDMQIQIPTSRVKLLVGPGGTTIGTIQRKSKARVQIKKEEEELARAWGSGPSQPVKLPPAVRQQMQKQAAAAAKAAKEGRLLAGAPGATTAPAAATGAAPQGKEKEKERPAAAAAAGENGEEAEKQVNEGEDSGDEERAPDAPPRKMTTVLIFGDVKALEIAERMIYEAIDNREQKAKQRQKEYTKKREEKSRARLLYHMRHTKNYEALELVPGASKADVKKAYRRLALLWHPDKHPDNQEEAMAKFQVIQRAYDSLMSTDEEEIQAQIAQ